MRVATVAVVAGAACLAAAVPSRSAASRENGCVSAAHVRSFHGKVSDTFNGTIGEPDAGQGGTETVALSRQANLQFTWRYIGGAVVKQRDYIAGGPTGGSIGVDDSYDHSGTGSSGSLQGSPRVGGASALIVLYPKVCMYQVEMSFLGEGTVSGNLAPQDTPLTQYSGSAYTPRKPIPASLHLFGSASIDAYSSGCSGHPNDRFNPPDELGCYEFGGGWTADYAILEQCHAPFGGTCGPHDDPEGSATITWNLMPVVAAQKKTGP